MRKKDKEIKVLMAELIKVQNDLNECLKKISGIKPAASE
jgi:hypothetical protein